MKRITLGLAVCALFAVPGMAATTLEFGPGDGGWAYDGLGMLNFQQTYPVTKGLASTTDTLVGAYVHIPDFTVGGIPGGPYTLTPATGNVITITDITGTITYLTGTLGNGDLMPRWHNRCWLHCFPGRHHRHHGEQHDDRFSSSCRH